MFTLLLCLTQLVLMETLHAHVFSRSGYFNCLHSEYTECNDTVFIVSIFYTVYSITTVSLNHAIIYATALR